MAAIVEEGIRAGALGFDLAYHVAFGKRRQARSRTFANKDELIGIDYAARGGHGIFEMASDLNPAEEEFGWMAEMSQKACP